MDAIESWSGPIVRHVDIIAIDCVSCELILERIEVSAAVEGEDITPTHMYLSTMPRLEGAVKGPSQMTVEPDDDTRTEVEPAAQVISERSEKRRPTLDPVKRSDFPERASAARLQRVVELYFPIVLCLCLSLMPWRDSVAALSYGTAVHIALHGLIRAPVELVVFSMLLAVWLPSLVFTEGRGGATALALMASLHRMARRFCWHK